MANQTTNIKRLDRLVRKRIRVYFAELDDGPDTILSEEDALGAAGHADQIYIDNTDWPATKCTDRAMDIAFEEKAKLDEQYLEQRLAV